VEVTCANAGVFMLKTVIQKPLLWGSISITLWWRH